MKKFLTSFAAVAAGFTAQVAPAAMAPTQAPLVPQNAVSATSLIAPDGKVSVRGDGGDVFDFVLKRSGETGLLMAEHASHASHASHRSHSSHYSSRN
jgi:hypothetical protein